MLVPLSQLFRKVSTEVRQNVLASCVVFLRTESIANSKPFVTYTIDAATESDFQQLKLKASEDVEFIAISAREDVYLTLDVLAELTNELNLHLYDRILIYRCGVNILCINMKRENGLSVYININDYRRCLHQVLNSKRDNSSLMVVGIIAATAALVAVFTLCLDCGVRRYNII